MSTTIHVGDALTVLRTLPSASVHMCVTSPPYYGLRDYGVPGQIGLEATPELWVATMVDVFREVRRVLRSDGVLFVNVGDSYAGSGKGPSSSIQRDASCGVKIGSVHGDSGHTSGVTPPPGYKPKDLIGAPWMLAFALRADGWYLRSEIIWCLSGGTKLYARTQKGDMPITVKDIERLRPGTVQVWNGEAWTNVLGVSETIGREGAIELELRSGERIGCTPHHEWPTQRGVVRADELQRGDVIQSTRLPSPAVFREPTYLPDDIGWFVGMYLAEGSRSGDTIQIASHAKETARLERLTNLAAAYGGSCHAHKTSPNGMTINLEGKLLNAVIDTYLAGRTSADKHLTNACWQRGDWFLRTLLRGYLEGDAHRDEPNHRWRLGFRRNYSLESDIRTLCARLGYSLRLKLGTATLNGKTFPMHRGEIRVQRSIHHNTKQDGEIVRIGRSRGRKFWHVGVEDAPHTFALASGVLTCNSKPNPMPESVTDRPTKAHEQLFLLSRSRQYYYDADAIREPHSDPRVVDGEFKGTGGVNAIDWAARQKDGLSRESFAMNSREYNPAGRNKRSVWTVATEAFPESHFATYPTALIEPCIKAGTSERGVCPECGAPWVRQTEREVHTNGTGRAHIAGGDATIGQGWEGTPRASLSISATGWRPSCKHEAEPVPATVLDCFFGAGTTGLVADRLGRDCIGIELKPEYAAMARRRIADENPMFTEVSVA